MVPRRAGVLLLAAAVLILSGCWDARQLNETALVDAVALDQGPAPGQIRITVATIKRAAFARDAAYPDSAERVVLFASTGRTMFDAVRQITLQSGEKLFWGHARAIILGEALARDGVLPWLDFFLRDVEIRKRALVYVVQGAAAREILSIRPRIAATPGAYLESQAGAERAATKAVSVDLREFSGALGRPELGAVAGAVAILPAKPEPLAQPKAVPMGEPTETQRQALRREGAAVLKAGRLAGWLNDTEARGLRWIQGRARRGALNVPCPEHQDQLASLEMFESATRKSVAWSGGELRVRIAVKLDVRLADQTCPENLTELAAQDALERAAERAMAGEIRQTLRAAQQELKADIFQFADLIERTFPQEWRRLRDRWDQVFPTLAVDVVTKVELRRSGRLLESIYAQRQKR